MLTIFDNAGRWSHNAQHKPGTNFIVDILSIGSLSRPEYLESQRATFGSHLLVRNFVSVDERDDTDHACHNSLTEACVDRIKNYFASGLQEIRTTKDLQSPLF